MKAAAEIASRLQEQRAELAQLESVTDDDAFLASRARRGELAAEIAELSRMLQRAEKREHDEAIAELRAELDAEVATANAPVDLAAPTDRLVALVREAYGIWRDLEKQYRAREEAAQRAGRLSRKSEIAVALRVPSRIDARVAIGEAIWSDVEARGDDIRDAIFVVEEVLRPRADNRPEKRDEPAPFYARPARHAKDPASYAETVD